MLLIYLSRPHQPSYHEQLLEVLCRPELPQRVREQKLREIKREASEWPRARELRTATETRLRSCRSLRLAWPRARQQSCRHGVHVAYTWKPKHLELISIIFCTFACCNAAMPLGESKPGSEKKSFAAWRHDRWHCQVVRQNLQDCAVLNVRALRRKTNHELHEFSNCTLNHPD